MRPAELLVHRFVCRDSELRKEVRDVAVEDRVVEEGGEEERMHLIKAVGGPGLVELHNDGRGGGGGGAGHREGVEGSAH